MKNREKHPKITCKKNFLNLSSNIIYRFLRFHYFRSKFMVFMVFMVFRQKRACPKGPRVLFFFGFFRGLRGNRWLGYMGVISGAFLPEHHEHHEFWTKIVKSEKSSQKPLFWSKMTFYFVKNLKILRIWEELMTTVLVSCHTLKKVILKPIFRSIWPKNLFSNTMDFNYSDAPDGPGEFLELS